MLQLLWQFFRPLKIQSDFSSDKIQEWADVVNLFNILSVPKLFNLYLATVIYLSKILTHEFKYVRKLLGVTVTD